MRSYGIPPKIIGMAKTLYDDFECAVVDGLVLFRDSLLPGPENGPGTQAGKERVLYYLQVHARNDGFLKPATGFGKTVCYMVVPLICL